MKNSTVGITVAGGNGIGNNANQLNLPFGVSVDEIRCKSIYFLK